MVGLASTLYIVLLSVAALSAIFAGRKTRRDAALKVLEMLLPRRRRDR
jgi:hypothetical protein